jgi:glycosyltransferase involved in cell wall biosynthesis
MVERPRMSLVVSTTGRTAPFRRLRDSLERCDQASEIELVLVDQSADACCAALLADRAVPYRWRALTSAPGLSCGRNAGLRYTSGDLIGFPDDDCWYPPDAIRRVFGRFEADTGLDGLSGRQLTPDGRPSSLRWARSAKRVTARNYHRTTISSTLFLARRLLDAVGGFDESIGIGSAGWNQAGEESDLILRALAAGARIMYEPDLLVYHEDARDNPSSELAGKMLGYGCGQGHLWRMHHWPRYRILYLLGRKTARSLSHRLRGQRLLADADAAFVRGCLAGLRGRPPADRHQYRRLAAPEGVAARPRGEH